MIKKTTNEEVAEVSRNLQTTNEKVAEVSRNLQSTRQELLETFDSKLLPLKKDISSLTLDMRTTKQEIRDIRLTLENETNKNIKIIAEGHLDLSRKLDEALKVENEKELLLLKVNHLENELRRTKERVEQIA